MKIRHILGGLLLALLGTSALAAGSLVTLPRQLVVDQNGEVRVGAKLYVFDANTETPRVSYTTAALDVEHANPIESVSDGLFPAVFVDPALGPYKLRLKDSASVTLWTEDNLSPVPDASAIGAALYPELDQEDDYTIVDPTKPYGWASRYGPTCDGTTNVTEGMQAAIDVASALHTEAVVPVGTGKCIVDALTFDASDFAIRGEGKGATLKASAAVLAGCGILNSLAGGSDASANQTLLNSACGTNVITVRTNVTGSLENVVIRDLTFEGNSAAVRGIWATGFTRGSTIQNVLFSNIDGCNITLNGSWSFTILANHMEGDGTLGTGLCLGVAGNGQRGGSQVVNAPAILGNEAKSLANGAIWNFGVGGLVSGNTWESNVTDGFHSQSVEGVSYTGNYHEGNGVDNLDIGGTGCDPDDRENTDCAESWQVVGNHFTMTTATGGNNIRINGAVTSTFGPNSYSGDKTQRYFLPSSAATHIEENYFWVPLVNSTYISNSSELSTTTNFIIQTNATTYTYSAPRLHATAALSLSASGTLSLFGVTPASQQADTVALTDSSGGSANNTVAALPTLTDSPASQDALRDDINTNLYPVLKDNYADLAAKYNALRAVLRAYGMMP